METKSIKSRVIKLAPIKWRELEFIQDENFKEWINDGDKKLIESLYLLIAYSMPNNSTSKIKVEPGPIIGPA